MSKKNAWPMEVFDFYKVDEDQLPCSLVIKIDCESPSFIVEQLMFICNEIKNSGTPIQGMVTSACSVNGTGSTQVIRPRWKVDKSFKM